MVLWVSSAKDVTRSGTAKRSEKVEKKNRNIKGINKYRVLIRATDIATNTKNVT